MAKLNPSSGLWDTNFYPDPDLGDPFRPGTVSDIAGDGNYIYLAGSFSRVFNGSSHSVLPYLARVDSATGVVDPSWDVWADDTISTISFVGSNLWIAGQFSELVGQLMDSFAIIRPFPSGYTAWLANYFTPAQRADAYYTATFQDFDGDGLSNLAEFAFNLNPLQAGVPQFVAGMTGGMPLIRAENIGGRRLTVEFPRRKSSTSPGISYIVEFTNTATGGWTPRGNPPVVSATSDPNIERVRVEDSLVNQASAFARVRVAIDPP